MKTEIFKFKLRGRVLVIVDWSNVYGWFSDPKSKTYLGWEVDPKKLFEYLKGYLEIFDKRFYSGVEVGNIRSETFQKEIGDMGFNLIPKEVKWVPVSLEKSHFKKVIKELFDALDNIKITNSQVSTRLYELKNKVETRLATREPDFDSNGNVQGEFPPYKREDEKIYDLIYDLIEGLDEKLKKLNINIDELQKHLSEPVMRRKCDFDVEISRDVLNLSNNFDYLILFSGDGDYSALIEDIILGKRKNAIVVFAKGHVGKEYGKLTEKLKQNNLKNRLFMCSVEKIKNFLAKNVIPEDYSPGRDS